MKLKKITYSLSIIALVFSAQIYAAPLDSAPTAVNFSGNVTNGTCVFTGSTADQVIELGDITITDVQNASVDPEAPSMAVDSTLELSGCSMGGQGADGIVELSYSGTEGSNPQTYKVTSGAATGMDFVIKQGSVYSATNNPGAVPTATTPNVGHTAVMYSGDVADSAIITIPIQVGVVRNSDDITSGDMSVLANITIIYS